MLSEAQVQDLKSLAKGKADSEQHFIDIFTATFSAYTKDPLRVEVQLRKVFHATETNRKAL